jgi:hypothetical protein
MKFCQPHWDDLKAKIEAAGLGTFVAKSGEKVVDKMLGGDFEPLMGAHNAILSNAMSAAGLNVMMQNEDGSDRCPLCYLIDNCPCGRGDGCPFRAWPQRAVDEQLAFAREKKFIPEPS